MSCGIQGLCDSRDRRRRLPMGISTSPTSFWIRCCFPPRVPMRGGISIGPIRSGPGCFLAPAIFALGLYLAYPVIETLRLSMTDRSQDGALWGWPTTAKCSSEPKFWEAMRNNMLWLIVVPAASTAFGLLAAQLTDRISWGNIAKSLVFMPMAISFVGASVIFKLVYDTRPEDQGADRCPECRLAAVRRRLRDPFCS